jgi:ATP-dependent DNA ligase
VGKPKPSRTGTPETPTAALPVVAPVAPMAAAKVTRLPTGPGWVYEPKFDGFRALAFVERGGVVLQSRQQRSLTDAFPDITATLTGLRGLGKGGLGKSGVVLDGELVIWRAGRLDFAALQDRLRSGPARVRDLAAAAPAAYVVFDLLAHRGTNLREHPYAERRATLEKLLTKGLPPGVVLTPTTTDPAVALAWLGGHSSSGIEGVVAKRADHPYRPGVRGWQKLRARLTAEAVIAGVLGPVHTPRVLLLGHPDRHGNLQVAGRTTDLTPATATAVGAVLQPHSGSGHPWPGLLPRSGWGRGPAEPLAYTQVRPEVVVELLVDPAVDGPRWRHPARFVRLRADLHPTDLTPTTGAITTTATPQPRPGDGAPPGRARQAS